MKILELFESKSAPLYHWMDIEKALNVLETDELEGRWVHDIPKIGKVKGTSLSRNKRLTFGTRVIRLTLDQAKLAQKYKIIPLDAELVFRHRREFGFYGEYKKFDELAKSKTQDRIMNTGKRDQFAEEFLVGTVKQLHAYVTAIEITGPIGNGFLFDMKKALNDYAKKFHVKIDDAKLKKELAIHAKNHEYDD